MNQEDQHQGYHASQVRAGVKHQIIKNPVFDNAKTLTRLFADKPPFTADWEDSPTGFIHYYFEPLPENVSTATRIIMTAALRMANPNGVVRFKHCQDPMDKQMKNGIEILLPSNEPLVPAQQMLENISAIRHALVDNVKQNDDGYYILPGSKVLSTLNVTQLLLALSQDYARQHGIAVTNDMGAAQINWEQISAEMKPQFNAYYAVQDGRQSADGELGHELLDHTQFTQRNLYAQQVNESELKPEQHFDHAIMNDAAMAMLSSAIGIVSTRARAN